jgi:glutamate--cysteine ligase
VTAVSRAVFDALRTGIYERYFAPELRIGPPAVGAEVEFLVLDELTRTPVPLHDPQRGLLASVRTHGAANGWREARSARGTPYFEIPHRGTLTFEPGGQIEIATTPCASASALLAALDAVVSPLRLALARDGVSLVGKGIDPYSPIESVDLQLRVDRYERMTRYFERLGPYGVRMMRQTAAVQISLDRGADPAARWRLLNDLAPFLIALFANSSHYAGVDTGHRSYRARCWRMLDITRTGVARADAGDPASAYTRFALNAGDMMRVGPSGEYKSFGDWTVAGGWTDEAWQQHLSTLFPEVRPRGHFEVRSCDAIDPIYYPALIVFLCGLVYDPAAAAEAAPLVAGSQDLLGRAGEAGLDDRAIASTVVSLTELALAGAARLGTRYVNHDDLEVARDLLRDLARRHAPTVQPNAPTRATHQEWLQT